MAYDKPDHLCCNSCKARPGEWTALCDLKLLVLQFGEPFGSEILQCDAVLVVSELIHHSICLLEIL